MRNVIILNLLEEGIIKSGYPVVLGERDDLISNTLAGNSSSAIPNPSKLTLGLKSFGMEIGSTKTLQLEVVPPNSIMPFISWELLDNHGYATITDKGSTADVKAVGLGTFKVRATSVQDPTLFAECTVEVVSAGENIPAPVIEDYIPTPPTPTPNPNPAEPGGLEEGEYPSSFEEFNSLPEVTLDDDLLVGGNFGFVHFGNSTPDSIYSEVGIVEDVISVCNPREWVAGEGIIDITEKFKTEEWKLYGFYISTDFNSDPANPIKSVHIKNKLNTISINLAENKASATIEAKAFMKEGSVGNGGFCNSYDVCALIGPKDSTKPTKRAALQYLNGDSVLICAPEIDTDRGRGVTSAYRIGQSHDFPQYVSLEEDEAILRFKPDDALTVPGLLEGEVGPFKKKIPLSFLALHFLYSSENISCEVYESPMLNYTKDLIPVGIHPIGDTKNYFTTEGEGEFCHLVIKEEEHTPYAELLLKEEDLNKPIVLKFEYRSVYNIKERSFKRINLIAEVNFKKKLEDPEIIETTTESDNNEFLDLPNLIDTHQDLDNSGGPFIDTFDVEQLGISDVYKPETNSESRKVVVCHSRDFEDITFSFTLKKRFKDDGWKIYGVLLEGLPTGIKNVAVKVNRNDIVSSNVSGYDDQCSYEIPAKIKINPLTGQTEYIPFIKGVRKALLVGGKNSKKPEYKVYFDNSSKELFIVSAPNAKVNGEGVIKEEYIQQNSDLLYNGNNFSFGPESCTYNYKSNRPVKLKGLVIPPEVEDDYLFTVKVPSYHLGGLRLFLFYGLTSYSSQLLDVGIHPKDEITANYFLTEGEEEMKHLVIEKVGTEWITTLKIKKKDLNKPINLKFEVRSLLYRDRGVDHFCNIEVNSIVTFTEERRISVPEGFINYTKKSFGETFRLPRNSASSMGITASTEIDAEVTDAYVRRDYPKCKTILAGRNPDHTKVTINYFAGSNSRFATEGWKFYGAILEVINFIVDREDYAQTGRYLFKKIDNRIDSNDSTFGLSGSTDILVSSEFNHNQPNLGFASPARALLLIGEAGSTKPTACVEVDPTIEGLGEGEGFYNLLSAPSITRVSEEIFSNEYLDRYVMDLFVKSQDEGVYPLLPKSIAEYIESSVDHRFYLNGRKVLYFRAPTRGQVHITTTKVVKSSTDEPALVYLINQRGEVSGRKVQISDSNSLNKISLDTIKGSSVAVVFEGLLFVENLFVHAGPTSVQINIGDLLSYYGEKYAPYSLDIDGQESMPSCIAKIDNSLGVYVKTKDVVAEDAFDEFVETSVDTRNFLLDFLNYEYPIGSNHRKRGFINEIESSKPGCSSVVEYRLLTDQSEYPIKIKTEYSSGAGGEVISIDQLSNGNPFNTLTLITNLTSQELERELAKFGGELEFRIEYLYNKTSAAYRFAAEDRSCYLETAKVNVNIRPVPLPKSLLTQENSGLLEYDKEKSIEQSLLPEATGAIHTSFGNIVGRAYLPDEQVTNTDIPGKAFFSLLDGAESVISLKAIFSEDSAFSADGWTFGGFGFSVPEINSGTTKPGFEIKYKGVKEPKKTKIGTNYEIVQDFVIEAKNRILGSDDLWNAYRGFTSLTPEFYGLLCSPGSDTPTHKFPISFGINQYNNPVELNNVKFLSNPAMIYPGIDVKRSIIDLDSFKNKCDENNNKVQCLSNNPSRIEVNQRLYVPAGEIAIKGTNISISASVTGGTTGNVLIRLAKLSMNPFGPDILIPADGAKHVKTIPNIEFDLAGLWLYAADTKEGSTGSATYSDLVFGVNIAEDTPFTKINADELLPTGSLNTRKEEEDTVVVEYKPYIPLPLPGILRHSSSENFYTWDNITTRHRRYLIPELFGKETLIGKGGFKVKTDPSKKDYYFGIDRNNKGGFIKTEGESDVILKYNYSSYYLMRDLLGEDLYEHSNIIPLSSTEPHSIITNLKTPYLFFVDESGNLKKTEISSSQRPVPALYGQGHASRGFNPSICTHFYTKNEDGEGDLYLKELEKEIIRIYKLPVLEVENHQGGLEVEVSLENSDISNSYVIDRNNSNLTAKSINIDYKPKDAEVRYTIKAPSGCEFLQKGYKIHSIIPGLSDIFEPTGENYLLEHYLYDNYYRNLDDGISFKIRKVEEATGENTWSYTIRVIPGFDSVSYYWGASTFDRQYSNNREMLSLDIFALVSSEGESKPTHRIRLVNEQAPKSILFSPEKVCKNKQGELEGVVNIDRLNSFLSSVNNKHVRIMNKFGLSVSGDSAVEKSLKFVIAAGITAHVNIDKITKESGSGSYEVYLVGLEGQKVSETKTLTIPQDNLTSFSLTCQDEAAKFVVRPVEEGVSKSTWFGIQLNAGNPSVPTSASDFSEYYGLFRLEYDSQKEPAKRNSLVFTPVKAIELNKPAEEGAIVRTPMFGNQLGLNVITEGPTSKFPSKLGLFFGEAMNYINTEDYNSSYNYSVLSLFADNDQCYEGTVEDYEANSYGASEAKTKHVMLKKHSNGWRSSISNSGGDLIFLTNKTASQIREYMKSLNGKPREFNLFYRTLLSAAVEKNPPYEPYKANIVECFNLRLDLRFY